MLAYDDLMRLKRELLDEQVLSVYIEGAAVDPAQRDAWRPRLRDALRPVERAHEDAPHAEREALRAAIAMLDEYFVEEDHAPPLRTPALAAFVTARGVRHESRLPLSVPTAVYWERGARVAPYVRAMLPERKAIVIVAGVTVAHAYTYDAGALLELETWEAPVTERAVYHMGDAPQLGFSPNTRGRTGKDEHDRDIVAAMHKGGESARRAHPSPRRRYGVGRSQDRAGGGIGALLRFPAPIRDDPRSVVEAGR